MGAERCRKYAIPIHKEARDRSGPFESVGVPFSRIDHARQGRTRPMSVQADRLLGDHATNSRRARAREWNVMGGAEQQEMEARA